MRLAKTLFVIMAAMVADDYASTSSCIVEAQRQRRKRRDDERDITAEEVDQITDDVSIEDNVEDNSRTEMMQEWDDHMGDFLPEDMLQLKLDPRSEVVSSFIP